MAKHKPEIYWVWRGLPCGRELLKKHGRWIIGSGASVDIVDDRWLALGEKALVKEGCNVTTVQELIDHISRSWKINSLGDALLPNSAIEALKTPIDGVTPLIY